MPVETIDLDVALKLLALPREVGPHPDSGDMISAGIGRFGPYLKLGNTYQSLPKDDTVLTIGINHAVEILAQKLSKSGGKPAGLLRELGEHPEDQKPVTLNSGRFGPYVKHGKDMASLTRSDDPDSLTLERALELIRAKQEKQAASGGKSGGGKSAGKSSARKPAAKTKAKPKAKAASSRSTAKKSASA